MLFGALPVESEVDKESKLYLPTRHIVIARQTGPVSVAVLVKTKLTRFAVTHVVRMERAS
jgi:hypothetical protein